MVVEGAVFKESTFMFRKKQQRPLKRKHVSCKKSLLKKDNEKLNYTVSLSFKYSSLISGFGYSVDVWEERTDGRGPLLQRRESNRHVLEIIRYLTPLPPSHIYTHTEEGVEQSSLLFYLGESLCPPPFLWGLGTKVAWFRGGESSYNLLSSPLPFISSRDTQLPETSSTFYETSYLDKM